MTRSAIKAWKSIHKRSEDYAEIRKGYAKVVIAEILKGLGPKKIDLCLDLGTGTGQIPEQLASHAKHIIGTDPEKNRIAESKIRFKDFNNIEFKIGSAEDIKLKRQSVDLVTAAQCFHYFDKKKFFIELQRILKPGGKVCVLWKYPSMQTWQSKAVLKIAKTAMEKFKIEFPLPRDMGTQLRSAPILEKLKDFDFERRSFVELSGKYHYSVHDWIQSVLWPMGAGTGQLPLEVSDYIANKLLIEIQKKHLKNGIFETFDHFLFQGYKA